jgi:hypothetical protein
MDCHASGVKPKRGRVASASVTRITSAAFPVRGASDGRQWLITVPAHLMHDDAERIISGRYQPLRLVYALAGVAVLITGCVT